MRFITLSTVSLFLLFCLVTHTPAQSRETKPAPATATISGRVTFGDQPASGVTVTLTSRRMAMDQNTPLIKAVTDNEGRFQLTNIAAGTYLVAPLAPGFLPANSRSFYEEGKSITIDEGETVEDVDFVIKRGGVITGRITDENHEPIIEIRVNLLRLDERGQSQNFYVRSPFMNTTDDRGVYRIYGLPAGRYKISVGEQSDSNTIAIGLGNIFYHRTFHPDVTDESKTEIIELADSGEAINVDVSINSKIKSHLVTGRMVYAATGKPVANVSYGYGTVNAPPGETPRMGASGWNGNRTNSKGEFRLENIMPGRYSVFVVREEATEIYSEPAMFDVKDSNVSGIEVKVRSGASISGFAVIEGANNPALAQALSQIRLSAQVTPRTLESGFWNPPKISSDGSFRITGLRAGKVQFYANDYMNDKKLILSRVELNGVEIKDGLELKDGEQLFGVRLVFVPCTAAIRGQITIENGELPEGTRLIVRARRLGENEPNLQGSMAIEADTRRRFILEGLAAGEYELTLQPGFNGRPPGNRPLSPVKQTVKVTEGAQIQVSFVLDLDEKREK
jgi:hypothetical protein